MKDEIWKRIFENNSYLERAESAILPLSHSLTFKYIQIFAEYSILKYRHNNCLLSTNLHLLYFYFLIFIKKVKILKNW